MLMLTRPVIFSEAWNELGGIFFFFKTYARNANHRGDPNVHKRSFRIKQLACVYFGRVTRIIDGCRCHQPIRTDSNLLSFIWRKISTFYSIFTPLFTPRNDIGLWNPPFYLKRKSSIMCNHLEGNNVDFEKLCNDVSI